MALVPASNRPRWGCAVLVCACTLACQTTTQPVAPAQAEPESESEDPPIAEVASPPAAAEPDKVEPVAPASGSSPAVVAEPGEAPNWSAVARVAKQAGLREPAKATPVVGLGGSLWAVIMRSTETEDEHDGEWSMHLLVLDAGGQAPRLVDDRALVGWNNGEIPGEVSEVKAMPATLRAEDFDGDGRVELLVRTYFGFQACAIGLTFQRELRIYALDDAGHLRAQLGLTLDDTNYVGGYEGKVRYEDRTADGHPDVIVETRTEYDGDEDGDAQPERSRETKVYAYRPAHDDFGEGDQVDFRADDGCPEPGEPYSSPL